MRSRDFSFFTPPTASYFSMASRTLSSGARSRDPLARVNARLCIPAARFHAGSATKGPFQIEGRRECRARRARPQPRVQNKKAHELVTAGRRFARHSPRNGFNGLLRALPGEPGFLSTIPAQCEALSRVDASVGASGPHRFAVRRIAPSSEAPPASTASHPTLVTIRETSLDWGGTADSLLLFLPRRQAKFRKIRNNSRKVTFVQRVSRRNFRIAAVRTMSL